MTSELSPEVDPLIEIQSLGRIYVSCRDETERTTIEIPLLKMIGQSRFHVRKIIERWIRCEEENVALRAENQHLESELLTLKARSLAEEPVIPPRTHCIIITNLS